MRINHERFGLESPLVSIIEGNPNMELIGHYDADGNYTDLSPKGEIRFIYQLNGVHLAILDTGKPFLLVDGQWKAMELVENPQFQEA